MDDAGLTPEFVRDFCTLRLGRSITPKLRWPHHFILCIQGDESVLLPADTDATDVLFLQANLLEALLDAGLDRLEPDLWILLQMTSGKAWDQRIVFAALGKDFAAIKV